MNTPETLSNPDLAARLMLPHQRRSWRGWLALLLLLLCLPMVLPGFLGRGDPPLVDYVTMPLQRGDVHLRITATGYLEPTHEVTVGSEMSGVAAEVMVDINDRVTKGQVLARIDVRRLTQQIRSSRAAVQSAQARVRQVKATLAENEASLQRLQELHQLSGGKSPSRASLINAEMAAARSQADLASAEAAVVQAEADLEADQQDEMKALLRSPIDGMVLKRHLEPGQTVVASFNAPELFVIAENLEQMKLKVAVAEADISRVKVGQQAEFTVDAWPERRFQAKVKEIAYGSSVTDNVVTYETELEVSNADLSLRPGMTATADIQVAERLAVWRVPNAALRFQPSLNHAGQSSAPTKSFVQSLIPMPPRQPIATDDEVAPLSSPAEGAGTLWFLQEGQPVRQVVTLGLSDGRVTEVSGEQLREGQAIILRLQTKSQP